MRLDALVAASVERVRRRAPDQVFALSLEPTLVRGSPARLDRAVVNLLENAVDVGTCRRADRGRRRGGTVTVRDHGPGIAEDEGERLFDRFYRSPRARGRAGLGPRPRDRPPGRRDARRPRVRRTAPRAAARASRSRSRPSRSQQSLSQRSGAV